MRIDELKKEVESLGRIYDLGLRVRKTTESISIDRFDPENLYLIAYVGLDEEYIINTNTVNFNCLPKGFKKELFNILAEFAKTPEDEREEEKRYYYRLKEKNMWITDSAPVPLNIDDCYLNLVSDEEYVDFIRLDNDLECKNYVCTFTDKEIQEVAKKHDIDLDMFDKIEVE